MHRGSLGVIGRLEVDPQDFSVDSVLMGSGPKFTWSILEPPVADYGLEWTIITSLILVACLFFVVTI